MSASQPFPHIDSTLFTSLARFGGGGANPELDLSESSPEEPAGPEPRVSAGIKSPRYVHEEEIARGGMGVVHRVFDTDLRRKLAMKVLLTQPAGGANEGPVVDVQLLARFLEEAQVTGQLDHPGIVPLHELGMDPTGRVYFTMRLVRGKHLGEIFELARAKKDGWNLERAIEALVKVCDAMAFAHAKGVVHRDLKPQNIMAGRFGEVYVMDWGLAKVRGRPDKPPGAQPTDSISVVRTGQGDDAGVVTIAGWVFGTPAYMSPEQAGGESARLDARSDVYSVGAILYQLISGHIPYIPSNARVSAAAVLQWVLSGPPEMLAKVAPDAPRELVAIAEKAMAREPIARYQAMRELGEDLRAWLVGRPVTALPLSSSARAVRWCRKYPWVAASLLAVTLGGAFGVWRVNRLSDELVAEATREEVAEKARMMEVVNALYSAEVTGRVDRKHVDVTHDWKDKPGAIPLPASFLTLLAQKVSGDSGGMVIKHYSDFPFRFRGPPALDDFGKQALTELRANPDEPVERVEEIDGNPVLRYAVARRMGASCVACHNSDPESTKTDWKVGDVRGVLEIDRPLTQFKERSRAGLTTALTIVGALVLGLTAVCAFALLRTTRR